MAESNIGAILQTLSAMQEQISKILTVCERLTVRQDFTEQTISEIKEDVNELKSKPGKRWEGLVTAFLAAIVGIIVGAYFVIPSIK